MKRVILSVALSLAATFAFLFYLRNERTIDYFIDSMFLPSGEMYKWNFLGIINGEAAWECPRDGAYEIGMTNELRQLARDLSVDPPIVLNITMPDGNVISLNLGKIDKSFGGLESDYNRGITFKVKSQYFEGGDIIHFHLDKSNKSTLLDQAGMDLFIVRAY